MYDATVRFCQRYFDRRDRTVDQMVQAARSGKQNIIEASMASGTSKEMEIKLTNVARASLEELLADYRDWYGVLPSATELHDSCRVLNRDDTRLIGGAGAGAAAARVEAAVLAAGFAQDVQPLVAQEEAQRSRAARACGAFEAAVPGAVADDDGALARAPAHADGEAFRVAGDQCRRDE